MEALKRRIFPMEKLITHRLKLEEIEEAFRTARSLGKSISRAS